MAESVARPVAPSHLILGLDLATNCGYAYTYWGPGAKKIVRPEHMGQWNLSAGPYDSGAIRFVRLRQFLSMLEPDLVAYEEVKNNPIDIGKVHPRVAIARAATAAELLGSFKSTVCTWCEENNVPCIGFPIGTIKKRATGKGNANKEGVIAAANALFGTEFGTEDYESTGVDNICDAAFVCLLAMEEYADGLPGLVLGPRTKEEPADGELQQ